MSYQDGQLSANLDPDSIFRCTSFGNIGLKSDIPISPAGDCASIDIPSDCDNGLNETCGDEELWSDIQPCIDVIPTQEIFIPINQTIGPDQEVVSPAANLVLPPNTGCNVCVWRIGVNRRTRLFQSGDVNYGLEDQVFGVPFTAPFTNVNVVNNSHSTIQHSGFSYQFIQTGGTAAVVIPFSINLGTGDNVSTTIWDWAYYQIRALGFCMKGCPT